jgi:hyperosmotically inducible protein
VRHLTGPAPAGGRPAAGARVAALVWAAALASGCASAAGAPSEPLATDAALAARVRTGLLADPLVGSLAIAVEAHDGIVTLAGNVPDASAARRVLDIVRGTPGVLGIVDRLARPDLSPRSLL